MEKPSQDSFSFPVDSDQPDPWLLISKGKKFQNHAFYSISKNELIKENVPDLRNKQISSTSYHEWVALIDIEKSPLRCCLLNTRSNEKIQLPCIDIEPESNAWFYKCILSKPPNDPDCHVLLLSAYDDSTQFCRIGDEKFIIKRSKDFGDGLITAINFDGKVYAWINNSCSFVKVDFVGKDVILKQLVNERGQICKIPWPSPSTSCRFADYLVNSSGELLLVHMICYTLTGEVAYFRIFKVNILEKECSELMSIGDRVIFLSAYESMSLWCGTDKSSLMKNSIYYTWKDRYLYVYNIEDRSKTLLKLCPIKKGTQSLMSWVMM